MSEMIATNNATTNNKTFVKATVRGTVVRKINTHNALILAIASSNKEANKSDFPRFVAFDNLPEYDKACSLGERVTITGHIRTSKTHPEGTLVPDTIQREKARIDAAFAGEDYKADMNEFTIRGTMMSDAYVPNDNVTLATLVVDHDDGWHSRIRVIAFGYAAKNLAKKKKGDIVDALGYVRTKSLKEVKEETRAQSFVITAIR